MKPSRLPYFLCFAFLFFHSFYAYTQALQCPGNIDFEYGDFTNWKCYTGNVYNTNGSNTVSLTNAGNFSIPDRMEIIGPDDKSNDPIAGFPRHCPNGSGYSIKLGNAAGGHEAEGISYSYTIPATATKFSLLYYYAIVLQAPSHQPEQMPRFRARIIDEATETEVNCVSFDFTSSGSLPGFVSLGSAVYKDWTPVSVDLSGYAGKTIRLEFITSDCTFDQHYGYAYIDVNSDCNGNIKGTTYCQGDTTINLQAPYGYNSYAWYSNMSFQQLISSTLEMELPNSIPNGSVFPVIVTPFPGFGCLDTLYAIISSATKPVSEAGANTTVCNNQSLQMGGTPNPDYLYSWTQASLLTSTNIANPKTKPYLNTPTSFILKTIDIATGCFSYDTALITPIMVDTSSNAAGKLRYCPSEPFALTLSTTGTGTQVQWFKENRAVTGADGSSFQPTGIGNYWAQIKQFGCTDTSRTYTVVNAPVPQIGFTADRDPQCINQPIIFTNTTSISGNETMTFNWRFDDGTTLQTKDAQKIFATDGKKTIWMKAVSEAGCTDSTMKTVAISTICTPLLPSAFTPNGDGLNDILKPFLAGIKALKRFAVYNRYGKPVFETTKENEGWNGTLKGTPLETGVFIWLLNYLDLDNKPVTKQGTVTLIR